MSKVGKGVLGLAGDGESVVQLGRALGLGFMV